MQKLTAILILSIGILGCTRSEKPERVHEAPIQTASPEHPTDSRADSRLDSDGEETRANLDASDALLAQARLLFQNSLLDDTRRIESAKAREGLDALNQAALARLDANRGFSENFRRLYKAAILRGCDDNLKSCTSVGFFRTSPNSARIVRVLAEAETSLNEYYRLLEVAYSIKNRAPDDALDAAYLLKSRAYIDELERAGSNRLAQHLEITTQLLERLSIDSRVATSATKVDQRMLEAFSPWDFGRPRNPKLARIDELVLGLAAQNGIYLNNSDRSALSAQVQSKIREALDRPDGVTASLQRVRASLPRIQKDLDLPEIVYDEYFLILDQLYSGRLTLSDASQLWNGTGKDLARVRSTVQAYARVRLALLVIEANGQMQKFFSQDGVFTSASVFTLALEEGKKVSGLWDDGLRRLTLLQNFNDRHLKDGSADSKSVDLFFTSVPRNIKFLSTYPSMLLVAFHLARLNFNTTLFTFNGPVTIDSSQIMQMFFAGRLTPWFEYGPDNSPLNESEIVQSFVFALKFGVLSQAGVRFEEFFKVFAEQMLTSDRVRIERQTVKLLRRFDNSADYQKFLSLCPRALRGLAVIDPSIGVEKLARYTQMGVPFGFDEGKYQSEPMFVASGLYLREYIRNPLDFQKDDDPNVKMEELAEIVRLDYSPKLDKVLLFAELVREHLKENSDENSQGQARAIELGLAPYTKARSDFYSHFLRLHRQTAGCLDRMIDSEYKTQAFLVRAFKQHLRDVHMLMQEAQKSDVSPARLNTSFHLSIDPDLAMPGLASFESGLGFDRHSYRFAAVQTLLRFKKALEHGARTERGLEPAQHARGSIALPSSINEFKRETRDRTAEIAWTPDVDEFVTAGLRALFNRREGHVFWFDQSGMLGSMLDRLKFMVAIYKTGKLTCESCLVDAAEVVELAAQIARWIELDADWTKTLASIGKDTRVENRMYFDEYIYRSDGDRMGLFDFPLLTLMKEALGDEPDLNGREGVIHRQFNPRVGRLAAAKRFAKTAQSLGGTAFPLPRGLSARLNNFYFSQAELELRQQSALIKSALDFAKSTGDVPQLKIEVSKLQSAGSPIVSERAVRQFRSNAVQFCKDTGYPLPADLSDLPGFH